MDQQIEQKIVERGQEFFNSISGEAPSIFNKGWWTGKVMDWSMKNEDFKVQLFRFVDVLPYLNTSESLLRHIREYFASSGSEVPSVLRWGAGKAGLGGALTAKIMGGAIRSNIESMGRQFIIGQNVKEAMGGLAKLRKDGFAFTVDLLGEASVNEEESDAYAAGYHEVLDALAEEQKKWPALSGNGPDNGMDWGSMPKVNISIKPSALYSRANPVALEDSVEGIYRRLAPLYQKTIDMGGFMCIDMEQLKYREITVELFKRLRSAPEFRHYPHLCLVQQAYLKDTEQAVRDLIAWARKEKLPIALRLVKGAYWDAETVFAKQCDWPVPVWTHKPESDMAHEKISRLILENHDIVYFACASHNVRSIAAVMEYARQLDVPEERYEFQVLYGMAEPVRKGLRNVAGRVRLYCPYGKLIPGMAYLVRRLLENQQDTEAEEYIRTLKVDLFADEVFVFTPNADVINLPAGATPIDFAYAIHSAVGNRMVGCKVNNRMVPIDHVVSTGEIIEVILGPADKGPSRDWLKIVRTSEAKSKIRNWFKKMRREENIQEGRDTLARELRREMIFIPDDELDEFIGSCCRRLRQNNAEELYAAIGYGGITVANCLPKLKEEWQKRKSEEGRNEQLAKVDLSKVHATDGVVVEGFDNTPIKFAKCCSPLPGDPIVGFITRGFGVSIHKQSCVNAISSMKDPTNAPRWVKAYWADSVKDSYKAGLEIVALDRNELLRDVLSALADIRVPIYTMNARQVENNCAVVSLTIGINNTEHLNRVVARLSKVKDVLKVTRS